MTTATTTLPETMKAFRIQKEAIKLSLQEVKVRQPGPGEALLKIDAGGLCHTDVGVLKGEIPLSQIDPDLPSEFTLGHEGSGTLIALGPAADPPALHIHAKNPPTLEIGARYAVYPLQGCMSSSCVACVAGKENICPAKKIHGIGLDGAWAEYAVVATRQLTRVPDDVSSAVACIATDAILTSYHAIMTRGRVNSDSTVLIIGLGGLGTNAIQIAKHVAGARRVYGADLKADSRALALTLGADEVFDAKTLVEEVQKRKLQITHVVDFVGAKPSVLSALTCAAFGATVAVVGLIGPTIEFPPLLFTAKEINLHGCFWGTQAELGDVLKLISEGKIKPEVSEKPLEEAELWIQKMVDGELKGRVVFVPK